MKRHILRYLWSVHVVGFFVGLVFMVSMRVFIREIGDIEVYSAAVERFGVGWWASAFVFVSAGVYTWSNRKRPIKWLEDEGE